MRGSGTVYSICSIFPINLDTSSSYFILSIYSDIGYPQEGQTAALSEISYNYHLVGGLTDRQRDMHDLMYSGLNYLGVAPTDDSADAHYSEIVENSGCLSQIMPPEIDKQVRVYTAEVVAPMCTEKGYTRHTCSICGDSWTDSETEATGHSFTQYVYNHDATTSADGTETAKCDYCDATDTRVKEGSKLEQPVEPGKPVYPVVPVETPENSV